MPTYVYLGHGADLVKKISKPGEPEKWNVSSIETVPEGCTYATISETGTKVRAPAFFNLLKIATDPIKKQLLMNPKENYHKIKDLVTAYITTLNLRSTYHFKLPGNRYINRNCNFILSFMNFNKTIFIYRSGLYDIEKTIDPPLPASMNRHNIIVTTKPVTNRDGETEQILTIGDIKQIYKGSIFPTIDSILKEMKPYYNINDDNTQVEFEFFQMMIMAFITYKITQRDLLERFPGNHFNFSCRGYGYGNDMKLTRERIRQIRQESKRQIYNLPSPFMKRLRQFNPFKRETKVAPSPRKGRKNRTRKV